MVSVTDSGRCAANSATLEFITRFHPAEGSIRATASHTVSRSTAAISRPPYARGAVMPISPESIKAR
jgi:hypothetical protein